MVQFHALVYNSSLPSNVTLRGPSDIDPIPDTSWCVTWYYLSFDRQLHGILPWADINRNCNIFFKSSKIYIFFLFKSCSCVMLRTGRFIQGPWSLRLKIYPCSNCKGRTINDLGLRGSGKTV